MKERPILFSAPMVRAILSGSKNQTRRVVKPQPDTRPGMNCTRLIFKTRKGAPLLDEALEATEPIYRALCPYGQPGDRLWLREGHALDGRHVFYRVGHVEDEGSGPRVDVRWRPSIHMPRWASRITLEITDVKVERLQEISEADAMAEGISRLPSSVIDGGWSGPNRFTLQGMGKGVCAGSVSWNAPTAKELYQRLWSDINGPGSWDANPWVWCVSFLRVSPNTQTAQDR